MTGTPEEPLPPLLSIVRGTPTPEELAAVVAVLAARGGGGEAAEPAVPSLWASKAAVLRRPLTPGPGAWAATFR